MKILLATDASAHAEAAAWLLTRLPLPGAVDLTVLTVLERFAPLFSDETGLPDEDSRLLAQLGTVQEHDATELLGREASRFTTTGWAIHTIQREGHVAQEIVHAAEDIGCDLVVLGARGLGAVGRFFLGSVSDHVVQHAPCSVLVAHLPPAHEPTPRTAATPPSEDASLPVRLLVAYDGSPESWATVEALASWPLGERAQVTIVTVLPWLTIIRRDTFERLSSVSQEQRQAATAKLEATAAVLRRATPQVSVTLREAPKPAEAILELASELGADLIVLGHHGKSRIERFMMGSVATRVVREAPCAVLVMRSSP
jgi:nucleotide-binding universal stress UspA family protein